MGQKKVNKEVKPQVKATPKTNATAAARTVVTKAADKKKTLSESEKKEKILSEKFLPETMNYLRNVLGIEVEKLVSKDLEKIANGQLTDPISSVIHPVAKDLENENGTFVEMAPVRVVNAYRIVLPYDKKTFKPVVPDDTHKVYVDSYPCFEYLAKSAPSQKEEREPVVLSKEEMKAIQFDKKQLMALQGLGVSRDRLYSNSFDAVPLMEKKAMLDGKPFHITGTVFVKDEVCDRLLPVKLNGMAKMQTLNDGSVQTKFEPVYPQKREKNMVPDLLKIRTVGNVQLDIFERDGNNHVKQDIYNNPEINRFAKELVNYGTAFGLLDGYVHKNVLNDKTGRYEDKVEKNKYQVQMTDCGGLIFKEAVKVKELDENGKPVMTTIGGKEVEKYHYEVDGVKIGSAGTVRFGNQDLVPASDKDFEDYKRGIGGLFKDVEIYDAETKKRTKKDLFCVPDLRCNNFPKVFKEEATKKILEHLNEYRQEKKAARKQNFAMGF